MHYIIPYWRITVTLRASEISLLRSKQSQRYLFSVVYCRWKHWFLCIACQCMPANHGASAHSQVLNASTLLTIAPIEFFSTSPGVCCKCSPISNQMTHFITTFDAWLETTRVSLSNDAHLFYPFAFTVQCFLHISIFLQLHIASAWQCPNVIHAIGALLVVCFLKYWIHMPTHTYPIMLCA